MSYYTNYLNYFVCLVMTTTDTNISFVIIFKQDKWTSLMLDDFIYMQGRITFNNYASQQHAKTLKLLSTF